MQGGRSTRTCVDLECGPERDLAALDVFPDPVDGQAQWRTPDGFYECGPGQLQLVGRERHSSEGSIDVAFQVNGM